MIMKCQLQTLVRFIMLGRLRTAGKYHWVKDELEYILKKIPSWRKVAATEKIKDSLKYLLVSGVFSKS